MHFFTQTVIIVGRIETNSVRMLGTGFIISRDGKIATSKHVTGNNDQNLVVLFPHIHDINIYQDTSDTSCQPFSAQIIEADPFRDIVILKTDLELNGPLPPIGSFDDASVSDDVILFGFPHCVEGRRVLTYQKAEIGAKILLECKSIKSKCAVINIQSRPGQSGSLVFHQKSNKIIGILVGAFIPQYSGGTINGVNPMELHQTTHCISAEYIKEMM